ncbi:MAG: type IV secretion protein Rhs, partial [Dysgonamonadaceae bacterium]|nr:type IV secretion protein Rhs [Dysgonamonadaceae bacterium]
MKKILYSAIILFIILASITRMILVSKQADLSGIFQETVASLEPEQVSVPEHSPLAENPSAQGSTMPIRRYLSDNREGIIGLYDGRTQDNPADNIFTIQLDQAPQNADRVWLCYELSGVADYTNVPHSINDRFATGGYLISQSGETSLQKERIHPAWLKQGANQIQFHAPDSAGLGYRIRTLFVEVEKGKNTDPLALNCTQTAYGNKAYIHGFIQSGQAAGSQFFIDGQPAISSNGEFEAIVPLNSDRKVEVKAILPQGNEYSRTLAFPAERPLDKEYALTSAHKRATKLFTQGVQEQLELETALLSVGDTALLQAQKEITIATLENRDLPSLDLGMSNLTAVHSGYRFLPHGEHFAQGANVAIRYDRSKLPSGFTEDDIRTYYFDPAARHWVALERDSIDRQQGLIVSRTTHFTDMINGVIVAPESPETQGFAPTAMSGIQAGDPTSKVQIIAPPAANNRGTASMQYSFELPPVRNGMRPNLGIQYNSDGNSGWLGEGWDLMIPGISVDTRWGVPRYSDTYESETYNLNGTMLVTRDTLGNTSVAHRDSIARTANRQFYPRKEGDFSQIKRLENHPGTYTCEVTDKAGVKNIYGGNGGVLKDSVRYLKGPVKYVIAEWKLSRMEEAHGDYVEYIYDSIPETVRGNLAAKALYLKEVHVGNKDQAPHTVIEFVSHTQKSKKTNHARYGFLVSNNQLLDTVKIKFEGQLLRSYSFTYTSGAFQSDLLQKITHSDNNGVEFTSNTLEYYNDVMDGNAYKPYNQAAESWNLPGDSISAGFVNPLTNLEVQGFSDKATALGGSKTTSTSISSYIGIGPANGDWLTNSLTVGGNFGYSQSTTSGLSTLVDINGDGLPDKVFQKGGTLYYRPNISQSATGEVKYGQAILIQGIREFSRSKSSSVSYGGTFSVGFGAAAIKVGKDNNKTTTKTDVYFIDVNGDGLVDLVANGQVYFNHIEKDSQGNLRPVFTLSSGDTPSPIKGGGYVDASDTAIDPEEQKEAVVNSPLQDVVRMWEAPYSGRIKIEGNIQKLSPDSIYIDYDENEYSKIKNTDSLRVSIQIENRPELWYKKFSKKGHDSVTHLQTDSIQKGQRIFFRLQSGVEDINANQYVNGNFGQVEWGPKITYLDSANYIDANRYGSAIFNASEANIPSSEAINYINSNAAVITVSSKFVKPITSDEVILKAILSNNPYLDNGDPNPNYIQSVVYQQTFGCNQTFNDSITFTINNTIQGQTLQFIVYSRSNVAMPRIRWSPEIGYDQNGPRSSRARVFYQVYANQIVKGKSIHYTFSTQVGIIPRLELKPGVSYSSIHDSIFMIVKSTNVNGSLFVDSVLSTQMIHINGQVPFTYSYLNTTSGTHWVECYGSEETLSKFKFLGAEMIESTNGTGSTKLLAYAYAPREYDGFGPMFRGWGQFVYNAGDGRSKKIIQTDSLELPKNNGDTTDVRKQIFLPMTVNADTSKVYDIKAPYFAGQNPNTWISGNIMSSSRLGEQDVVLVNPLEDISTGNLSGNCLQGGGAFGVRLETKNSSEAAFPIDVEIPGFTHSNSIGKSQTLTSFMDVNGDGYPDIITQNQIQLTSPQGSFRGEQLKKIGTVNNNSEAHSLGLGGNPVHAFKTIGKSNGGDKQAATAGEAQTAGSNAKNSMSVNVGLLWGKDGDETAFVDINGDGLPDKIKSNKQVCLNLGYSFSEPIDWGLNTIQTGSNNTINAGMGFDFGASISVGFGLTTTSSHLDYSLMDINADGLPDKVRRQENGSLLVSLNTGNGFAPEIVWNGIAEINQTASTAESLNSSIAFIIPIPIPFVPLKLSITPGINASTSMSREKFTLRDVDGDGYPDVVSTTSESQMSVKRSTIARTNKLKTVTNPLGGVFTIDYARSQATYDHPGGKWVMSSLVINDGINDDGPNPATTFEYADGKHERHEREFLGFGKVTTKNLDTGKTGNPVYRRSVQEFDVDNYYTAGNLLSESLQDAAGNKYNETVNEYSLYQVTASNNDYSFTAVNSICSDRAAAFTPLKRSSSKVYEGASTGLLANESYYEYYLNGRFGEIQNYYFSDQGSVNTQSSYSYRTSIEYTDNLNKHILGLPVKVEVRDLDDQLYRKVEASYNTNYANHLTQFRQTLDAAGNMAVTDYTYDAYGNITKKTLPANSNGQRMFYEYTYDNRNMYVRIVEDAFGYSSELKNYDYRYGIPLIVKDMNYKVQETTIDNLGRIVNIIAPEEQILNLSYTIHFDYQPLAVRANGAITQPAYAITKHYDLQHDGNDLETVTFVDGFGRAVQVKKDGVVTTGTQSSEVMLVSGRNVFDAYGRISKAYYPITEPMGTKTVFKRTFDTEQPTATLYDILDRPVSVTLPDGSVITTSYTKEESSRQLITTVTDPLKGKQLTYADGSGRTARTEQTYLPDRDRPGQMVIIPFTETITTSYFYDPIGQL